MVAIIAIVGLFVIGGILMMLVLLSLASKPTECYRCKFYDYGFCTFHKKQVKGTDLPCDDGEVVMQMGNPYRF